MLHGPNTRQNVQATECLTGCEYRINECEASQKQRRLAKSLKSKEMEKSLFALGKASQQPL
jgi:hypothetical protein